MNRAAAELNTVQSNVTARIQQLDSELGTALFERHARGVRGGPLPTYEKAIASDDAKEGVLPRREAQGPVSRGGDGGGAL